MRHFAAPAVVFLAALAGAQGRAPILDGLGQHRFPVTTTSPEAQEYFDQGLVLAYGFNHEEAHRSFMYAAALDPKCAMAYWGAALVLGPNINSPMNSRDNSKALELAEKALANLDTETPLERALVMALQKRYAAGVQRKTADENYAEAMRSVTRQFPNDGDVLTLTTEALMDLHPWDYWTNEQKPKDWTQEIMDMNERALAADPMNPGANHFAIHLWEASATPERATPSADRLPYLAPGVEHLVHMPGHIWLRVGRYHDATEMNLKATDAYDKYAKKCTDFGLTAIGGYEAHNWDFVWEGSSMEGRSDVAMRAAEWFAARNKNDTKIVYSRVRFGKWAELLAMTTSNDEGTGKRAATYYGRALAQLRLNKDVGAAQSEYAALLEALGENPRSAIYRIMRDVTAGEIAAAKGDYTEAVRLLEAAKSAEDTLGKGELHGWHLPVRLVLGKILIDAGRADEAVKAYRENLDRDKENGWALFGLAQALEAQGNKAEAGRVMGRFRVAWQYSDVKLTSSRF